MKNIIKRLYVYVGYISSLTICIIISSCIATEGTPLSKQPSKQVSYKGMYECDGMKNEVSFIYDETNLKIYNFQYLIKCTKGGSSSAFVPIPSIMVEKDGSFYFKESGRYVKGKILIDGHAEGEAINPFVPLCDGSGSGRVSADGACTSWKAKPELNDTDNK